MLFGLASKASLEGPIKRFKLLLEGGRLFGLLLVHTRTSFSKRAIMEKMQYRFAQYTGLPFTPLRLAYERSDELSAGRKWAI